MMTNGRKYWLLAGASMLAGMLPVQMASAQNIVTPADAADDASASSMAVGDIIVTAQKREERLRDVPLSITAVSGTRLANAGISDTAQLEKIAPGFVFRTGGYGTPIYSIRGIGFYDTALGVSPTVSVYLDQAPLPYSAMTAGATLDVERVEVLKGPQGTLFGQNSTGGAINYVAAKPTVDFHMGGRVEAGRFGAVTTEAYVSGQIAPTLTARVSGRYDRRSGWQKQDLPQNAAFGATASDSLGKRRFAVGRVLLNWQPTDTLSFDLNVNGWRDNSDTQASQFVAFSPAAPANPFNTAVYTALRTLTPTPNNARLAGWTPGNPLKRDADFHQISLRSHWNVSDAIDLTAITNYARYEQHLNIDTDGTAFPNQRLNSNASLKTFSQEVRLSGDAGAFSWMLGGSYGRDNTDELQFSNISSTNAGIGPLRFNGLKNITRQRIETYSGFGMVQYEFNEQWSVQGAVRYSKENRDYAGCNGDPGNGLLAIAFNATFGTSVLPGGCTTRVSPTDNTVNPINRLSLDQDNVSWRGNVSYKPTDDALLYANVTKGYKSGSFPAIPSTYISQLAPAVQESVLAYEAGYKVSLFDRRLQLDGAAFYYDYANKQLLGTIAIPPFGFLPKLVNIPKSRVIGAEFQITAHPVDGLTLSGGTTYVNTKVKSDPPNPTTPTGQIRSFVGEAFPGTPKWQFVGSAEYRQPVTERLVGFVGGAVTARSSTSTAFGRNPLLRIQGYTLLDLQAGVEAEDGRWRVAIWGRNITNKFYTTNVQRLVDNFSRTAGMPVTYGMTLSVKY